MKSDAPAAADDHLLVAVERAAEKAEPIQLARLLGELERLKATLWQRLALAAIEHAGPPAADPLDDLRHLTPQQVAEILSLKAAYIHELCRTGRISATKSGKYWMIPVAGLRRWLAYQKRDVDPGVEIRIQSRNHPGGAGPHSRRSSAPRTPTTM